MATEPFPCTLQLAVGRHETCPGDVCPFWQDGACAVAALRADVELHPELAELLLDLRGGLADTDGWSVLKRLPRADP
jgi:hypothetical protein